MPFGSNRANVDIHATDKTGRAFASARNNMTGLSKAGATAARSMAAVFGATVGIASLIRLSRAAIEYGSSITDAAVATRVGVEEYQVLAYAAQEAGTGMDKVTMALAKTQKATNDAVNGLTTYTRAFDALGINLKEFQKLTPDRQFEALGKAVVSAEDEAVAYASILDIIGSRNAPRLLEVLKRLGNDGFDLVAEAARNAGQVMTEETARSMDDLADALARMQKRFSVTTATMMAQGMAWSPWGDAAAKVAVLDVQIDKLMRKIDEPGHNQLYIDQMTKKLEALLMVRQEIGRAADLPMITPLDAAPANAVSEGFGAGATDADLEKINTLVRSISDARGSITTNAQVISAELQSLQADLRNLQAEGREGSQEWAEKYIAFLEKSIRMESINSKMISEGNAARRESIKIIDDMLELGTPTMDELFDKMEPDSDKAASAWEQWRDSGLSAQQMLLHGMETAADGMTDALMDFVTTGKMNFSAMVSSMLEDIARLMIYQNIVSPLVGGFSKGIGDLFKAEGGPVSASQPYIVGEKGPELFMPGRSGTIVPNQNLSAAAPVNITFTVNAVDAQSFAGAMVQQRRLIVGMVDEAVNRRGKRGPSQ